MNLDYDNKHICEVFIQIDAPFLDFRTDCLTLSFASGAFFVVPHLSILTRNIDVLIYFQDREYRAKRKTLILMNTSYHSRYLSFWFSSLQKGVGTMNVIERVLR